MTNLTRRQLLTGSALAGGAALLTPTLRSLAQTPAAPNTHTAGEWIPSCCNMCGGQCGIMVHVVNGKAVKIEPNPYAPNNFSNNSDDWFANHQKEGSQICPKGNAGLMTLYDPDRVQKPLRRTNPNKGIGVDPGWKEISWDEAFGEITARLKKLQDANETHKLIWFSEDHSFTHIQGDFCKLYGTPNYSNHSNLCDTARKSNFKVMLGDERPLCDFANTKYILFFGWNPTSALKWVHLGRVIPRAIERGAKLVVVDPYHSKTATKGEWIPIRPGTDGALALAMAQVIISENLHDKPFIDEWTVGFDKYAEYVKDKTPEWAEKITTVPAETIRRLAKELATTKPAIVDVWSGPGQHSNQFGGGWAIGLLAALIGQIDKPGTLINPVKKGNKHQEVTATDTAAAANKQPRLDGGKDKYPFFHGSGVYTEYINRLLDGKGPYQPKVGMVIFQNMAMSIPGTNNVVEALKKLEFLVVVDIFKSETAELADILIPGALYLERYDLNTQWVTWPVLGLRQPVVKPIFGQPTEYEFITELGRRLNLTEKDGKEFFWLGHVSGQRIEDRTKWYEEFLSKELITGEPKMSLEDLKKLPGAVWVSSKGTAYNKFKATIPEDKMKDTIVENGIIYSTKEGKKDKQVGFMKTSAAPAPAPAAGETPTPAPVGTPTVGFMTPSGKIQFADEGLAKKKDANGKPLAVIPEYTPRDWQPDAQYPLYLINWKEASHTHSRTQNNQYLVELQGENPLMINVDTATKYGLKSDDIVLVESPYGKVQAKVKLTAGIHPEVVGLQHGFGHWALGKTAKGRGFSDGVLRPTKSCPISGQALHKECCVKIYKA
ncbi:MAG: molybdopterin-dependent oxidoreductase [Planctomycetes bacterium]|nr:molybdopterin-dependent oxidoreductase [Planctomycetota bacterium]